MPLLIIGVGVLLSISLFFKFLFNGKCGICPQKAPTFPIPTWLRKGVTSNGLHKHKPLGDTARGGC